MSAISLRNWHSLRSIATFSNRDSTRPDHDRAVLRTRFLPLDRKGCWRHVGACIESLGRAWQLQEECRASGQFRLTRKTLLRWFTSDVVVSIWPADERRMAVDVVSSSRIGRVDFGQNARNIRDFYRALEMYLRCLPPQGSLASGASDQTQAKDEP